MSEDKLFSYEVPQKFAEWLLAMGCPAEKVPTVDKVTLMCRGQYYMVWRSLMEHVYPKNIIRDKRLQVFCNDVTICQEKSAFSQNLNLNVIVPEQLCLWQQQKDLKEKVYDAENRLKQSQETLNQLMDKITTKVSQRNVSRQRIQDLQRRVWLLQQVAEELQCRKDNLEETWTIANSLCCLRNENEIQNKVDKCVAVLRRQGSQTSSAASLSLLSNANPVASSSAVSIQSECADTEEQVSSLVRCGAAAWAQLRERRAGLAAALAAANAAQPASRVRDARATPQSVLAHTASLHCTLALETMKNRVHIKHTRSRLASSVTDLNVYLSGEACELLVLRCEKARSEARVNTLRGLLQELTSRSGIFKTNGDDITDKQTTIRQIATTDKAIETKRDELKRLLAVLSITERKIHNVKECLVTVFNNFQKDSPINDTYRGKGIQVDFPKESISTLRQFYEERRERRRNKPDLSMEFDVSDYSFSDAVDGNPRFIDELKIYLKKFNLEKNKKLVLDSGEKIWIFETVQSLISRLHSLWLSDDVSCSLIYPTVGLRSLWHLVNDLKTKELLEGVVKELNKAEVKNNVAIDINSMIEQEAELIDKIKKRIGGNLTTLQHSEKSLELGQENLKFWADNKLKKYISNNRTVDGKTYKDYEAFYLECLSLNV